MYTLHELVTILNLKIINHSIKPFIKLLLICLLIYKDVAVQILFLLLIGLQEI